MSSVLVALTVLAGTAPAVSAGGGVLPDDLTLTYALEYRGIPLGTLEKTLTRRGERYAFESRATPTGLGRLVTSDSIDESGEFEVRSGILRPLRYSIVQSGGKGYDRQVRFDWQAGKLVFENAERSAVPLPEYTQDAGSIVYALMLHGAPQGEQLVHVTDGKRITQYRIRPDGHETLDTPIGRLDTVRVVRERPDRDQATIIWLALDRHNLPVKIEKRRDGKAESSLLIESVTGLQ